MPIPVDRFLDACGGPLRLRVASGAQSLSRSITDRTVRQAGLAITGEDESVHEGGIQILGGTEVAFLRKQPADAQIRIADLYFARKMACVIVGGGFGLPPPAVEAAARHGVPLLVSDLSTADLLPAVQRHLDRFFGETGVIHGVLVDVLGVGVVLLGKSGVGKSECALDLVLHGHRFVSDDVIRLERVGPETVLGAGDDLTGHHMEIRGLGIVSVADLFGPTAVLDRKKIELVLEIEEWDAAKDYDRLGVEERRTELLGVSVPTSVIPVSPGRNLATIVEVAVRNLLLKRRGVFSAADLVGRHAKRLSGGGPK